MEEWVKSLPQTDYFNGMELFTPGVQKSEKVIRVIMIINIFVPFTFFPVTNPLIWGVSKHFGIVI